jgi:NAD(P)-dependent dehydrogenase (short-subunit alcohol dehydrogenase family)
MAAPSSSSSAWTLDSIPELIGTTAVVTGPSVGGIGYNTALELARAGAHVILAGRSRGKLDEAAREISLAAPGSSTSATLLDLTDFSSVRRAAEEISQRGPLDLLVNNAGVMATPLDRTADGLELQIGTNHFGPFLLTGLLYPALSAAPAGRVVSVASLAHLIGRSAPLADPRADLPHYRRWPTYGRSKVANLLFTYELDRRLRAAGSPMRATAAHPGWANTHLITKSDTFGTGSKVLASIYGVISQSPAGGALPTLMAATADIPGGSYVGPGGPGQTQGAPRIVSSNRLSHDPTAASQLWDLSLDVTGVTWL